jgi:hypothetical protein
MTIVHPIIAARQPINTFFSFVGEKFAALMLLLKSKKKKE